MRHSFYDSPEYRKRQSQITKCNQDAGKYLHLRKQCMRECAREGCIQTFLVPQSSPKLYCTHSCAARVRNSGRTQSESVRQKIALSMTGKISPYRGIIKVPRIEAVCSNPKCKRVFKYEKYRRRVFCSLRCAMRVIGASPTSPKASRGKAGVRKDISQTIYFYSRWEANMARLYSYLGIPWVYAPKSFDIGGQSYTPDFYLPEEDTYIEIKNFWGDYSRIRDAKFRDSHPHLRLRVILADEYRSLEEQYAGAIPNWEYKNSAFSADGDMSN